MPFRTRRSGSSLTQRSHRVICLSPAVAYNSQYLLFCMSLGSPSARSIQASIFGPEEHTESPGRAGPSRRVEDGDEDGDVEGEEKRQSMYVEIVEEMLLAIVKHENHLLDPSEVDLIDRMNRLPYPVKYLLIRLCLRKTGKWHRLSSLKYRRELGEDIPKALKLLCMSRESAPAEESIVKIEEREVVDLTHVDDGTSAPAPASAPSHAPLSQHVNAEAGPSSVKTEDTPDDGSGDLSFFAQDHTYAELPELLECLSLEELRQLAKDMKFKKASWNVRATAVFVSPHVNATGVLQRVAIEAALLKQASSQTILPFSPIFTSRSAGKQSVMRAPQSPVKRPQSARLRQMVMKILGSCVRVNESVVILFRRLNLIYFRCTQYTPTILTPSILSRAHKRNFHPYVCTRTSEIWPTRAALLAYERALELEAQVDSLNDSTLSSVRARSRSRSRSTTAHVAALRGSPVKGGTNADADDVEEGGERQSQRVHDARAILVIFETVYEEWKGLTEKGGEPRPRGLERFDRGHVLTRLVQKGADAFGTLKEYDRELDVLEALLKQRRWRRGRRGKWYDRRALVLTRYGDKSIETLRHAMLGLIEALNDKDTHLVYRSSLSRRLTALEKKLGVGPDERHQEDPLVVAEDIFITGVRLRLPQPVPGTSKVDRNVDRKPPLDSPSKQSTLPFTVIKSTLKSEQKPILLTDVPETPVMQKGKSTWQGKGDEVVNVETFALQDYERSGYKGYHCEGRIVTTLFGLLFWDIIFAPIPGAFETPYQMAPLDLFEDTFFYAREDLIEARLDEISDGKARELIERVDGEHRERGTWCVGVRWDFPKEDLLEIAECFKGEALACVCRVLCEDYAQRGSGVPDLFMWNLSEKHCKFVEVKGPGDKLQENQKLWIDVMQRAEVSVEVCHVEEYGKPSKSKQPKVKREKMAKPPSAARSRRQPADSESETAVSEWGGEDAGEDELNASQYIQGLDMAATLVATPPTTQTRKRPAEDTSPGPANEVGQVTKRPRTTGSDPE
ncbi:hypothetical protein BC834DRAFT_210888 [Gloeopeniophorella convolvens]|nr:hypothetical protein BC834DRAFT_210888 [Gloeopeniophorella convolvens]